VTTVLLAAATVRLRTLHRVALAASGFEVHEVARPEEIGNRLARGSIDAMVIDVTRLYGGSALLQQLSHDAELPSAVLALTPVDQPAIVLAALDAGADDYLPITAGSERVVAAVARIVGGSPSRPAATRVPIGRVSDDC
jgi:DNA-binding response OmpR family regulator